MAKSKYQHSACKINKELDNDTVRLIQWIDKMEKEALDKRQVTTIVTKHGTVLVQVR